MSTIQQDIKTQIEEIEGALRCAKRQDNVSGVMTRALFIQAFARQKDLAQLLLRLSNVKPTELHPLSVNEKKCVSDTVQCDYAELCPNAEFPICEKWDDIENTRGIMLGDADRGLPYPRSRMEANCFETSKKENNSEETVTNMTQDEDVFVSEDDYTHRWTARAAKIKTMAQMEARKFNHVYVGTEHLLLGLTHLTDGVAVEVLRNIGIDFTVIRNEIDKLVRSGSGLGDSRVSILTLRAKRVMMYACEEAAMLKCSYIGSEHVLLGLLRESEGIAVQVLLNIGVTLEAVRQEVKALLGLDVDEMREDEKSHELSQYVMWQGLGKNGQKIRKTFWSPETYVVVDDDGKIINGSDNTEKLWGDMLATALPTDGKWERYEEPFLNEEEKSIEPLPTTIPLTPRAKNVLKYAEKEAECKACRFVYPHHILIGILQEAECVAAGILMDNGITIETVRQAMYKKHWDLNAQSSEESSLFLTLRDLSKGGQKVRRPHWAPGEFIILDSAGEIVGGSANTELLFGFGLPIALDRVGDWERYEDKTNTIADTTHVHEKQAPIPSGQIFNVIDGKVVYTEPKVGMTFSEAVADGQKARKPYWSEGMYIYNHNGRIRNQHNVEVDLNQLLKDDMIDWERYEEPVVPTKQEAPVKTGMSFSEALKNGGKIRMAHWPAYEYIIQCGDERYRDEKGHEFSYDELSCTEDHYKEWELFEEKPVIEDDESVLRFYHCESEDSYLLGQRHNHFYYARWKGTGFRFEMSRHLPWGETIATADGNYTYPSEPKEMDFHLWLNGFLTQRLCEAESKQVVKCYDKDKTYRWDGKDFVPLYEEEKSKTGLTFLEATKDGQKARRSFWNDDVFVQFKDAVLVEETGSGSPILRERDYHTADWEIFEKKNPVKTMTGYEAAKLVMEGKTVKRLIDANTFLIRNIAFPLTKEDLEATGWMLVKDKSIE